QAPPQGLDRAPEGDAGPRYPGLIALIQRVSKAAVAIDGRAVGEIGRGILALVGVERGDGEAEAARLAERVLGYRIFPDGEGRMNRSLLDIDGGLLVVSQFTLVADTRSGTRPGFSRGASPAEGEAGYNDLVKKLRKLHLKVETGRYGAEMQVSL